MRKHNRLLIITILTVLTLTLALTTSAFAITESEVQAQVNAQGRETVSGNVFIWFLCAIAFLKISQKIDSFMSSLGINVGHTGGNMLAEAFIAARGISAAKGIVGGGFGGKGSRSASAASGTSSAGGASGGGFMAGGLAGIIGRKVQGGAVANATDQPGGGMFAGIGSQVFQSSLDKGGDYANNVIGAVAKGNIAQMGSIKGDKAAGALQSYFGGSLGGTAGASPIGGSASEVNSESGGATSQGADMAIDTPDSGGIPMSPGASAGEVVNIDISEIGNAVSPEMAAATIAYSEAADSDGYIPPPLPSASAGIDASPDASSHTETYAATGQSIQYSEVEIGGGRITGYESPSASGESRQFAMYSAEQYIKPESSHDTLTAVDGSKWYRQYARNAVEKTPYKAPDGRMAYNETIVQKLPPMPKRKDRV